MSLEQLQDIIQQGRADAQREMAEPPVSCPHDGELLDVHPNGTRNCPLGNYIWRGEPKLI